ncbi:MAG: MFS transporter [Pseudomonadota bacterium]
MSQTSFPLIFALWGAGLGAAAQYGKMSVIFDQLPDLYPDAGATLGWVVSLVGSVGILFGVVAGLLVARIRFRRALLLALWLGALTSAAQALTLPLPWLLITRVVEGISHLGIVVAAPTLIAQLSAPQHRGFTLTLWGTFFGVAFALLTALGRPLSLAYGVPALFLAHALYMAFFALYLGLRLRHLPESEGTSRFSVAQMIYDHAAIYRSPRLAAPAVGWLFYTFSFVSLLTVLPPFVAPDVRAFVMGAMPLMSIAISLTLGVVLLNRFTAVQVVQLGFFTSAVFALWLWIAPGDPAACLALAGAMGLVQGASFAAVPQLNAGAQAQARANGALAQTGNLGNTLGTPVIAFALASLGYAALPLLIGIAFVCGFCLHALMSMARQR